MNATVRSLDDAKAKQSLLAQYIAECERIDAWKEHSEGCADDESEFGITIAEKLEVFERRRDRLENALKNAGIRLHAEAADTLPSIARAQQAATDKDPS
jgi:hypothetical protein